MTSPPLRCITTASSGSPHHCITTGSASSLLHCFCTASSSWLLLRITTASSTCLHYCITTALSSPWLLCLSWDSSPSPLLCSTTALSSWLLLCISAASSIGLFLCFTTAPFSSLLHCVSSASSSSLYHCISMALFFALLPDMTSSLLHLSLVLLFLSPLAATCNTTFPWTLQPGAGGGVILLLDPPRAILPGAAGHVSPDDPALEVVSAPSCFAPDDPVEGHQPATYLWMIQSGVRRLLLLDPPRMIQSGASGRHLSPEDLVRGKAAPAACSGPDDPVRGVWTPSSAFCCCFSPDDPVQGPPWRRHHIAASPGPRPVSP